MNGIFIKTKKYFNAKILTAKFKSASNLYNQLTLVIFVLICIII